MLEIKHEANFNRNGFKDSLLGHKKFKPYFYHQHNSYTFSDIYKFSGDMNHVDVKVWPEQTLINNIGITNR